MLTINNTTEGYLKNVEIKGNTIQNQLNLADIKSVGKKLDNQDLYEIPLLSCGKNMFDGRLESGTIGTDTGLNVTNSSEIRSIGYIKIPVGKSIFISTTGSLNFGIRYYDKTLKYLGYEGVVSGGKLNVPSNAEYFRFKLITTDLTLKIQVETDLATPYEPYQSNKITILSPCQIEKVGDISDRIVEKNGVWGVEKNIGNYLFSGNENWIIQNGAVQFDNSKYYQYSDFSKNAKPSPNNVSNSIIGDMKSCSPNDLWNTNVNGIAINNLGNLIARTNDLDVNAFKNSIKNKTIKYIALNQQFIPLPHDQQILLKTFDNKTNISFLTEIEGTIKAQVPKSMKATVNTHTSQIENIYDELDRVKKLEESTVSTVTTDKDFANVQATSQGYFEDVKLSGKTLVNICPTRTVNINKTETGYKLNEFLIPLAKPNTLYTVIVNITKNPNISKSSMRFMFINGGSLGSEEKAFTSEIGIQIFTLKTLDAEFPKGIKFRMANTENGSLGEYESTDIMIFEGDLTENSPSGYIEGLKSVGDGVDELVVSSVNDNLIDDSPYKGIEMKNGVSGEYAIIPIKLNSGLISFSLFDSNLSKIRSDKIAIAFMDKDKKQINFVACNTETDGIYDIGNSVKKIDYKQVAYIKLFNNSLVSNCTIGGLSITHKNHVLTEYIPSKADKKRILYYDPTDGTWKKPTLREGDTIEKHADGKYYYHQRSPQIVLNGIENINITAPRENTLGFSFAVSKAKGELNIISDKFPTSYYSGIDSECIFGSATDETIFHIRINKSKLETPDLAGFKKWLQANNVAVVYQLAQEKVFECTNIDLITYQNETNYVFNGGVISPKTSLKVQNNISNVVSTLQRKVSVLESYIVEMFRAVLSGDMRSVAQVLYPNDFVHESVPMEKIK